MKILYTMNDQAAEWIGCYVCRSCTAIVELERTDTTILSLQMHPYRRTVDAVRWVCPNCATANSSNVKQRVDADEALRQIEGMIAERERRVTAHTESAVAHAAEGGRMSPDEARQYLAEHDVRGHLNMSPDASQSTYDAVHVLMALTHKRFSEELAMTEHPPDAPDLTAGDVRSPLTVLAHVIWAHLDTGSNERDVEIAEQRAGVLLAALTDAGFRIVRNDAAGMVTISPAGATELIEFIDSHDPDDDLMTTEIWDVLAELRDAAAAPDTGEEGE